MTDIDDKLRKLSFHNPGVTRWLKLSDEDIAQIKQAFQEAGWLEPDTAYHNNIIALQKAALENAEVPTKDRYGLDEVGNLFGPTSELMTGQEWYERFVEEYVKVTETPSYSTKVIFEIAKRASGVEGE